MSDERDRRRNTEPMHAAPGELDTFDDEDTPRPHRVVLDRAALERDMAQWEPFQSLGRRIAAVEGPVQLVTGIVKSLGRKATAGLVVGALALAGGLIDYGIRLGKGDAAADQLRETKRQLAEAMAANQRQDIEIAGMRAQVRALERNHRDGDN